MKIKVVLALLYCCGAISTAMELPISKVPCLYERINGHKHFSTDQYSSSFHVNVAVVDTGFDSEHELLQGRLSQGWNARDHTLDTDASIVDEPGDIEEGKLTSHGTHVAGIIAQLTPKTVKTIPYKLGAQGNIGKHAAEDALRDIAKRTDIHIVNISMSILANNTRPLYDLLLDVVNSNKLIIISAGNDNELYGENRFYNADSIADLLADADGRIILAGASYHNSRFGIERLDRKYSNRAGLLKRYYITAPGTKVTSSIPSDDYTVPYGEKDGTSMAAPVVAGVLANIMARIGVNIDEAQQALFYTTVIDIRGHKLDPESYGCGMLHFDNAFQEATAIAIRKKERRGRIRREAEAKRRDENEQKYRKLTAYLISKTQPHESYIKGIYDHMSRATSLEELTKVKDDWRRARNAYQDQLQNMKEYYDSTFVDSFIEAKKLEFLKIRNEIFIAYWQNYDRIEMIRHEQDMLNLINSKYYRSSIDPRLNFWPNLYGR